ncbi:hypothetical protein GH5_07867 [Leishmania sp. Ghana 2012 LV757]|uniref:hypothetical protein n=1 Tax=Leishmania sp. Ghana 2012 LV757 TaxID=2803181 RepID=UPI001B791252|nr:hypothetical protein GH5_07867 [Leishmania sp. Ghana 2012 LV757]
MKGKPAKNAAMPPLTNSPSCGCGAPEASLPSVVYFFPSWYEQATRRLLHARAYYEAAPLCGACGQPAPTPSPSSPAPSPSLKLWLICAIAAVSGTCGVIVGARLRPWLNRRATRLYYQREAKHRNSLMLLPSPAAVARPRPWWWRRLSRACMSPLHSADPSLNEARRLDYGHAAEWLAAWAGHRWLPKRISRPTLLKLYSPARRSAQSGASRRTDNEVQWGTRMMNKGTHTLTKHSVAAAAKRSTASLVSSALFSVMHLTPAPLLRWQPLPQHAVDVFVPATCCNTESPRFTTPAAVSPLLCLPRQGFTLLYDPVARLSVWCGYYLTRETVDRARRQSRCLTFFTDRSLDKAVRRVPAELKARGHDRGHLAPHASVAASAQAAIEAALLSNVQLQHRHINRGVWRWLEAAARAYVRQQPVSNVPRAVARQQRCVEGESTAGAAAAPPLEAASYPQLSPSSSLPPRGARATRRRGRLPKSLSPVRCTSTRRQAAKRRSTGGCSCEGLRRDSEIISRLLAASNAGSGTDSHLQLRGDGARGFATRILRCCRDWWLRQWWCCYCTGGAVRHNRGLEVAVNVGPLYFKQVSALGQDNRWRCCATTVRAPALAATSSTTTSRSRLCCAGFRKAHDRPRDGKRVPPPVPSAAPPRQPLFIPDAFFFSLWNVHTHEHVHLIVPNHPDAAAIQAVTAAVAARRPTAAGARTNTFQSRRRRRVTHPSSSPSDELEKALRSLVVSTGELEQLFAASLVELRSRCMSAGVLGAASRDTISNIDHAASPVALRTHFNLFPVYRQRWMWRSGGSGWRRVRSS